MSYILSGAGFITQRYKKRRDGAKAVCKPFCKKIRRIGDFFILLRRSERSTDEDTRRIQSPGDGRRARDRDAGARRRRRYDTHRVAQSFVDVSVGEAAGTRVYGCGCRAAAHRTLRGRRRHGPEGCRAVDREPRRMRNRGRVDEIEKKPNKRYETVVTAIITALVGGLIGYCVKILGF